MKQFQLNRMYTKGLGIVKMAAAVLVAVSVVGCSGQSPIVSNADRNEIITIGDSIFDLSGELQLFLEQKAGQTFRDYTQSGDKMADIDLQYEAAKIDNSVIETILMDTGGNDILIPALLFDPQKCKTTWYRKNLSSTCKSFIDDLQVQTSNMLNKMDTDGVSNVIFLGYYHPKGGKANLTQAVDYGDTKLGLACNNSIANCTFLDPRGLIVDADIISDEIHPSTSGSQKLADLMWPELQPLL